MVSNSRLVGGFGRRIFNKTEIKKQEEEVTEAKVTELKEIVIGDVKPSSEGELEKPAWQAPKAEKDPIEAALLAEIESK